MLNFISKRIKSIGYAFKGILLLVTTEASIKVQLLIAVLVTIAGFYFKISATEWMLQTITIALIVSIEGLNTAVEKIADFIHPDFNNKIGFIKDIAAGAVFVSAFAAVIVGCLIYLPKIF
ncbi:diacylglycerol kinase [Ascidiimonas sp. W6]|uniref:diacylglycerol kinase n=1 Tax=Ascidiimonas meishanensis TaxID=3128903 RepID=UPI0030EBD7F8